MSENRSLVDILLDDDNCENITVTSDDGTKTEFEQVAIIPIEENVYALLHPITKMDGVSEDQALVFLIDEENDRITLEQDDDIVDEVFEEYYELLEENGEE
jgi:hypothetical protein